MPGKINHYARHTLQKKKTKTLYPMCPIKLNVQCAFRKIRKVRYTPLGKCCHARQAFLEKLFISALPFQKTHVRYALIEKK